MRSIVSAFALAAALLPAGQLHAQGLIDSIMTPHGPCEVWVYLTNRAFSDSVYKRCAIDRGPRTLPESPMPPAPRAEGAQRAAYVVIVKPNGRIDSALTQLSVESADTAFQRQLHATLMQWRFSPGFRRRRAVRAGFALHVRTDQRNDTLPARLEWRYREGINADTLRGTWITEAPLPALSADQVDSVHAATLRRLLYIHVLAGNLGQPYCIVLPDGDSTAHARATRLAAALLETRPRSRAAFGRYGCERDPTTLRLILPRVHHTENGRVVLRPSGDHLANYPRGYVGRSWRAWSGRCVGTLAPRGSAEMDCDVAPIQLPGELAAFTREREEIGRQARLVVPPGDSLLLTVMATTSGAWYADTMRVWVRDIPRLSDRAIMDPIPPCGPWAAHSEQELNAFYLVHGDPTSNRSLMITAISPSPPPADTGGTLDCESYGQRMSRFTAFLIGDLGARVTVPVTLCFFDCATKSYVIDPARHTLAARAHFRFRLADLRPATRTGKHLEFRLHLAGAPPGVVPIYILHDWRGPGHDAHFAWKVAPNTWDSHFRIESGNPRETEVYIYLFVR